ncbi:hypothetical protein OH77DRAFT_1231009 [Trametes cingulata]|nr:hypothetical protein OH77DRAFT_1231009 [Trametes cingulata]
MCGVSRHLTAPGAAGLAAMALNLQCYNSSTHGMRSNQGPMIAQQAHLTGAAAGPWATTTHGKEAASKLYGKAQTAFPHDRVTMQLESQTHCASKTTSSWTSTICTPSIAPARRSTGR